MSLAQMIVSDSLLLSMAALALACILGSAAATKWRDREAFGYALENYDLLPASAIPAVALGIPIGESAAALGLVLPAARPFAAAVAAALFALFALAIAINLARGRSAIDCGCGGASGDQPISWWLVARNVVLGLLAIGLTREPATRDWYWIDWLSLAGGTAALVGCYALLNQILANAPRLEALRRN